MEIKIIRSIKMNSARLILQHISADKILRLRAKRSVLTCDSISRPVSWAQMKDTKHRFFEVDYTSYIDGPFSKDILFQIIKDLRLKDLPIQNMVLKLDRKSDLSKQWAKLYGHDATNPSDYAVIFEEYTVRQEGEINTFTKGIKKYHDDHGLNKLGFHAATLDFAYVLPYRDWKEVTQGKMLKIRRIQFEGCKRKFQKSEEENIALQKNTLDSFFSDKDMLDTRTYGKTSKDAWVLLNGVGE